ncbi:MAG: homocysteine S-methyltransferase family protein, partial [Propionibacteriaceae bacterium]|nr:homocysteine S-methyltransferase family protein [Propionibacteriaceae bacterium]
MSDLRSVLSDNVLILDGATGTMLQAQNLAEADFLGFSGCNEVLNLTRPDAVAQVHRGYLAAGADCVETNTFGANLTALGDYGIAGRIAEYAEAAARIARSVADEFSDLPRYVLGSIGPGTKLATLGQVGFVDLRDSYQIQAEAMAGGGVDAFQIETCQDLLQAKAAVIACHRANSALGTRLPILLSVTLQTTGTMLVGSDIAAVLTAVESLGVDAVGVNCGTGPGQMRETLRYLAGHSRLALTVMPNAGMPELSATGATYPMGPTEFAEQVAG